MGPHESARSFRRRLRTLEHAWQFRRCYDAGRKLVSKYSVIFVLAPLEPDGIRVGVVASKRVGGAVIRNRAKRLLREAARHVMPRVEDTDLWVVFVAKSSMREKTAREVQDDIEQTLVAGGLARPSVNDRHRK